MSYGYDYDQDPQGESGGTPGRGRRRRESAEEQWQEFPEQYQSEYLEHRAAEYPQAEPQAEYRHAAPYDAQWEHSGLGWDPQAWREATAAEPRWDEPARNEPRPSEHGPNEHRPNEHRTALAPDYAPEVEPEPDSGRPAPGWDGFDGRRRESEFESFAPGPDAYDPDPERGRERLDSGHFDPEDIDTGRFDTHSFDTYRADPHRADPHRVDPHRVDPHGFDTGTFEPESERDFGLDFNPDADPEPTYAPASAPAPAESTPKSAPKPASQTSDLAGRGAFGAAGLAVVAGISAIAGTPVLAIVVALSQLGLAIGWQRTVAIPKHRRTIGLIALTGFAASAIAFRIDTERAPGAIATAVGIGFVLLAVDQLMRRNADAAPGPHRLEALAAAVTGAAFAALPAGYLVAQRQDSKLTAACALGAAVAVLCSALVGGGVRAFGVFAAAVAGTAVGGLTALSLSSPAGAAGGAMGGAIAGLLATGAARIADRLGAEGSDVRISSQALPMAFAAVGAAIAVSVLR
jgi:hypothetical protein